MASNQFKKKYRPDCLSTTISMDDHVSQANPHDQYLLRSEYREPEDVNIYDILAYVDNRSDLALHTDRTDKSIVAASVINELNNELNYVYNTLADHRTKFTQAVALNQSASGDRTDHLDSENKNLYAARTHTHTPASIGAATADHNHNGLYSVLGHNHDDRYSRLEHTHPQYVLYNDLSEVGIYSSSVNVMEKINNAEAGYTNDCNNTKYLVQGSFYIYPTPTYQLATGSTFQVGIDYYTKNPTTGVYTKDTNIQYGSAITGTYYTRNENLVEHGPAGVDSGFLVVRSSTDPTDPSGNIIQVLYARDMAWKREITKYSIVNYVVTSDSTFTQGKKYYIADGTTYVQANVTPGDTISGTYYEMSIDNTTYTFGDWMPLVETTPIGSLMFCNRNDVPKGYVEANGGAISSKSYPLLWRFALNSGQIVAYDNWVGVNDGCYAFSDEQQFGVKTIQSSDADKGLYVEDSQNRFVELTSSNIASFQGSSKRVYDSTSYDESVGLQFRLPNLGGNFLKMWASGSSDILGKNVAAGLPNILGRVSSGDSFYTYQSATGAFSVINGVSGKAYAPTSDSAQIKYADMSIDASRSNPIYGNSNTVTPKNISIRVFIKAYNGSLIHQDVTATSITSIVLDALNDLGYATSSTAGFVRLATTSRITDPTTDDPVQPSVVTAQLLHDFDAGNVKAISINGNTYTPVSNIVTLPDTAEGYGNRVTINSKDVIECSAILNIADATNVYEDFVIPESIVSRLTGSGGERLDSASVSFALKCMNANNALGYPRGAVVLNPICSQKPNNEVEYMSHPCVTIFEDEITYANAAAGAVSTIVKPTYVYSLTSDTRFSDGKQYYTKENRRYSLATVTTGSYVTPNTYYERTASVIGGTSTDYRVIVRLYWPLMWFIKRFTPMANDGSKTFPLIPNNTSEMSESMIENAIRLETANWAILINVAL